MYVQLSLKCYVSEYSCHVHSHQNLGNARLAKPFLTYFVTKRHGPHIQLLCLFAFCEPIAMLVKVHFLDILT